MLILSYPRTTREMDGTLLTPLFLILWNILMGELPLLQTPMVDGIYHIRGFQSPHKYWAIWSVLSISIEVLILSYLCHIVHSIVHVRPRFCSYKRSRDYLSCSFSLIDNLPWFLLSPHYIYLNSKTLATVYLWYIWFLPGWSAQKSSVWFMLLCPNGP